MEEEERKVTSFYLKISLVDRLRAFFKKNEIQQNLWLERVLREALEKDEQKFKSWK